MILRGRQHELSCYSFVEDGKKRNLVKAYEVENCNNLGKWRKGMFARMLAELKHRESRI